jgi:hypothetical protein
MYSLHVSADERAKAKAGETLTVGRISHHGVLLNGEGKVACVKPGTMINVAELRFSEDFRQDGAYHRPIRHWEGKAFTAKLTEWLYTGSAGDCLELPDGMRCHLTWLDSGMKLRIARKVRKDKGIKKPRNLDKVLGLDQIRADVPVKDEVTTS